MREVAPDSRLPSDQEGVNARHYVCGSIGMHGSDRALKKHLNLVDSRQFMHWIDSTSIYRSCLALGQR